MGHSREDDDTRLPDGMVLTGYDADSGRRYYLDSNDGSTWIGAPYVRYGTLSRIETPIIINPEESEEEYGSDIDDAEQDIDTGDQDIDTGDQDALSETPTQVADSDDHDCQSIASSALTSVATASRPRAGSVTPTQLEHDSESSLPGYNGDTISVEDLAVYVPPDSTKSEPPYVAGVKDATVAVTVGAPTDAKWKRPMLRQITRIIMATKRKIGSSPL